MTPIKEDIVNTDFQKVEAALEKGTKKNDKILYSMVQGRVVQLAGDYKKSLQDYKLAIGARFMLYGTLTNLTQRTSKMTDLYFLMTMKPMCLQTGMIEWQDQKQILKKKINTRILN